MCLGFVEWAAEVSQRWWVREDAIVMYLGHFFKAAMAWKPYGYYIESFLGTYICWCFLAGMTESCNSPFLSCNCVCGLWHKQQKCHWDTEMMSERRRCHYYARGKTQHEETFNVRHLCIQQCLTDFLLHWTTHNGSWKCALKNAANVHTKTVLSARLGLVHVCLRPPCRKQEAKIQAQTSQILDVKREWERVFFSACTDRPKKRFIFYVTSHNHHHCVLVWSRGKAINKGEETCQLSINCQDVEWKITVACDQGPRKCAMDTKRIEALT